MSARLEELVKLKGDVMRLQDELNFRITRFADAILGEIIEERDRIYRLRASSPAQTLPAGLPCVAEIVWTGDEDVTQPADASDSSAVIPPAVIEKLDRCAE